MIYRPLQIAVAAPGAAGEKIAGGNSDNGGMDQVEVYMIIYHQLKTGGSGDATAFVDFLATDPILPSLVFFTNEPSGTLYFNLSPLPPVCNWRFL
jgi:hypothetical protein